MSGIEAELVGGPFDGEKRLVEYGSLFVYITVGTQEFVYGLGDDGKYHYCPEILEGQNP